MMLANFIYDPDTPVSRVSNQITWRKLCEGEPMPKSRKPTKDQIIADLQRQRDYLQDQVSFRETTCNKVSKELASAKEKIKALEGEVRWYQRLSQNLSEAVCAYMRSR